MIDSWEEIDFRDGTRLVPPWIAAALIDEDPETMTYAQAMEHANAEPLRRLLNGAQGKAISDHRARFGGRG